jgi:nitroimidazol reductase NimA-like FMN-containing flavoprotein (pyridoxamine 5'-phosphate oxidase superfamily)
MGYVYDDSENSIYFHCAKEGRKIDTLSVNPKVWGVVVLDEGIQSGACVNLYASATFSGKVEWVKDPTEKKKVMMLFAEKLSSDTESVKARLEKLFTDDAPAPGAIFGKIKIEELSGKRSTEMTEKRLLELITQV